MIEPKHSILQNEFLQLKVLGVRVYKCTGIRDIIRGVWRELVTTVTAWKPLLIGRTHMRVLPRQCDKLSSINISLNLETSLYKSFIQYLH